MGLDKDRLVKVYINRLVRSLVPDEFGEEFTQSISTNLINDLINNDGDRTSYDTNQLLYKIKTYFLSNNDSNSWVKFQNLLDQLSSIKSNEDIVNYLVFLSVLQGDNKATTTSPPPPPPNFLSPQTHHASLPTRLSTVSPQQHTPFPFPRANSPIRQQSPFINHNSRQSLRNSYAIPSSRHSSISSRKSLHEPRIYDEPMLRFEDTASKPLAELIAPYYQDPEPMILTYLSYSLLGLDSKILQFDDSKNQLILPQGLNPSYIQLLSSICECGLLYRFLNQFIKSNKQELNSPIKLAYLTIVEKQLQIYGDFINQLFNKTNNPSSLIAIYHSISPWIYNLRTLYYLIENLNQNGDEFLSQVYELTKFGDLNIKSLSVDIFKYIGQPYYEIIEHWMIRGDLIDDSNEYFIKFNPTTNFNDVIQYLPEKIPKFIPQSIGKKLFHIGKILIFLNKCCKQLQWLNDYADKYTRIIYQLNQGLQSMTINEISRIVNMQYQQLLNYLTWIIYGKPNELFIHLVNFKRFYFMENNDFIENLIVKGQDIFQEASTNISSNQLSTLLTEAIATTSVKNNPFNNRLDARVLDLSHGALGWDVFTIEYRIDDLPIHYLLQSQMNQYLKMFNFLWRLRQLQFLLNENFLLGNDLKKVDMHGIFRLYRKLPNGPTPRSEKVQWIVKSFNTVGIIRFKFINYLNVLINYLSFDVIETNFQNKIVEKLFKSVNKKSDLININPDFIKKINEQEQVITTNDHQMNDLTIDEIINTHTVYLNIISKNKLLNEDSHGKISGLTYIEQLHSLLELIFDFIKSSEHFYGILINYVLISNIDNEDTTMDDEIVAGEQSIQESVRKIYHEIYLNYKVQLDTFIKDLRNDIDLREISKLF